MWHFLQVSWLINLLLSKYYWSILILVLFLRYNLLIESFCLNIWTYNSYIICFNLYWCFLYPSILFLNFFNLSLILDDLILRLNLNSSLITWTWNYLFSRLLFRRPRNKIMHRFRVFYSPHIIDWLIDSHLFDIFLGNEYTLTSLWLFDYLDLIYFWLSSLSEIMSDSSNWNARRFLSEIKICSCVWFW